MQLDQCHNVAELRDIAARKLPKAIFDYLEGGAEDEVTLRRNRSAFSDYEILPRVLNGAPAISTKTSLFRRPTELPFFLSPTGMSRMFHPDGELAAAGAASAAGIFYGLSTLSTVSLEDVAKASTGPKAFQIYVFKDRGLTRELVERCKAAKYDALLLTVDTPSGGNRERDIRNGLFIPPRLTAATLAGLIGRPTWSIPALVGGAFSLANFSLKRESRTMRSTSLIAYANSQLDRALTWKDAEWLASLWGGPIAIKGLMTAQDAVRAGESGATAVMVSNHGGRQLDGAPAPIDQIASIADAVGGRLEIIMDGGVRRGSDIFKALARGASACAIGRAYLYGLAAGGKPGVARTINILRRELHLTMMLAGANSIPDIKSAGVRHRSQIS